MRQDLVPNIHLFKIAAPAVAKKAQPGQFVVIRIDEKGERIPLTFADWDEKEGAVSIVFMEVGTTTRKLALLKEGDSIANFIGPLGVPTHIGKFGTVVCVAGGFGAATIMSIARAMKKEGIKNQGQNSPDIRPVNTLIMARVRMMLILPRCALKKGDRCNGPPLIR